MDVDAELISAVREGNVEAVDFLLCPDVRQTSGKKSQCADVNARNGEALVTAVKNEDFKMVEFLLSRGADIHASEETPFSYDRERALQAAVETGNFEMVELLLSHGADPNNAASYYEHEYGGESFHDVLSNAKDPRVLALLFSYGLILTITSGLDILRLSRKEIWRKSSSSTPMELHPTTTIW